MMEEDRLPRENTSQDILQQAFTTLSNTWKEVFDITFLKNMRNENDLAFRELLALDPTQAFLKKEYITPMNSLVSVIKKNLSIIEQEPNNCRAWQRVMLGYLLNGDYVNSFFTLSHLAPVIYAPSDHFIPFCAAVINQQFRYYQKALEGYKKALSCTTDAYYKADLQYRTAILYRVMKEYIKSIELMEQVLGSPPEGLVQDDIRLQIAYTRQVYKDYVGSNKAYMELIEKYPNSKECVEQYCWSLSLQGNMKLYDTAEELLKPFLDGDMKDPVLMFIMARIKLLKGDTTEAFVLLKDLVYAWKDSPLIWCAVGNLYFTSAQYEEAIEAYKRAVALYEKLEGPWLNMGLAYVELMDIKMAIQVYQKGKEVAGNSKLFEDRLKELLDVPGKLSRKAKLVDFTEMKGDVLFVQPVQRIAEMHARDPPIMKEWCFGGEIGEDDLRVLNKPHQSLFSGPTLKEIEN